MKIEYYEVPFAYICVQCGHAMQTEMKDQLRIFCTNMECDAYQRRGVIKQKQRKAEVMHAPEV